MISGTTTVEHGSDGTKTIAISAYIELNVTWSGTYISSLSNSGTLTLTALDRYPTSNQSLASRTETSLTVNWKSDSVIDTVWYSTNGGSNWSPAMTVNASSGSYTISGLTAGTSYSVVTSLRSKTSGLYTNSSASSWSTYRYPYCNSAPDFTIGNNLTIGLYNPLGRSVTITMIGDDSSQKPAGTYSGKSVVGFRIPAWVDFWYSTIPSKTKGQYSVKVTYNDGTDHTAIGVGGQYSIVPSECGPSANTLTYRDTNIAAVHITGDDQKIVQQMSTVVFSVTDVHAKNHADISMVSVQINGVGYNMLNSEGNTYTSSEIHLDYSSDIQAELIVVDSRGMAMAARPITVTMLPYSPPTAIISLQRQYNYYSTTYFKVDASYSSLGGGNQLTIEYQTKPKGGSWSGFLQISNRTQYTINLDNQYDWTVQVVIRDSLGATKTYNVPLQKGTPIEFWDAKRNSVGINCFPQSDNSFWVNGHEFVPENYGYHDFDLGSRAQTVTADRYVQLLSASDMNSHLPSGCVWVKAEAIRWRSATGAWSLNIYGDGTLYLIMENSKSISNLKVRCFFAKCVEV